MLIILVISGVLFGAWMLLRPEDPSHLRENADWLNENIWRVASYKKLRNDTYDIYLLEVEPAMEESFEDLKYTFEHTSYSSFNSYHLGDGVNCQGMTVYLASWCERNYCEYSVAWTTAHTLIYIRYDGTWYEFNFDEYTKTITEVLPGDVKKGLF